MSAATLSSYVSRRETSKLMGLAQARKLATLVTKVTGYSRQPRYFGFKKWRNKPKQQSGQSTAYFPLSQEINLHHLNEDTCVMVRYYNSHLRGFCSLQNSSLNAPFLTCHSLKVASRSPAETLFDLSSES